MIKKLLPLLTFLVIVFSANSQTDYSKVTFSSKIYKYKNDNPRTQEIGIDKNLVINIIELLSDTLYSEREKTEIVNRAWLAFKAPKTFDFVYKDFAIKTNKSWSQISSTGNLVVEPNPYLTEWTINDDEFPYFQIALNKILDYYSLISYADDVSSVKASFNELLVTRDLKFNDPTEDDWAYSYLQTVNTELAKKGLIALVTKGYYDIIVCKINKQQELTDLFKKIEWDLVTP